MTLETDSERGPIDAPVLTFRGVRGSIPVSGTSTERYGGRTLSIDVRSGGDSALIIDGGTGIATMDDSVDPASDFHVLLTHYHWDHIQGILFFAPLYERANTFTFYGHEWQGLSVAECLGGSLRPPWFPVSLADTDAGKQYADPTQARHALPGLHISSAQLQHPQGVTAYRIDGPNRSVVIATDCETGDQRADGALRELASGANVLIHDAQYTPEEHVSRYRGWGHSTWAHAAQAAIDTDVDELILISHAPTRSDDEIDVLVDHARARFENTRAAHEGLELSL